METDPEEIYERMEMLGQGNYGQVYKARDSRTG